MQFIVDIRPRAEFEGGRHTPPAHAPESLPRYINDKIGELLFDDVYYHHWSVKAFDGAEASRMRVEHAHARRITFDPHMDMATKIDALLGVFAGNLVRGEPSLGKADWIYDAELDMHVPCCSQRASMLHKCGNGPLTGDAIATGDCGEHG